ncbi:ABC transporter ATP-binding protein [[Eubacterium] cellulosolvens]
MDEAVDRLSYQMELRNVSKEYDQTGQSIPAIQDVSFSLNRGEFACVVGPSGCGKSTLLKMAAGLDRPTSGEIRFCGEPVTGPHSKISMVFQSFALFPWRTVVGNVEYGLEVQGLPKAARMDSVQKYLEMVGLDGYGQLYPKQLSGGMKQRVGIARALAVDPDVILMDEAFSAIDEFTAETLREEVADIHAETEKTFVLVTHNLVEAVELADKIIVLSSRPARVKKVLNVDLERPRDRTRSEFVHAHKGIFALLKEELETTMVRRKIKRIPEFERLSDIEAQS